jgi:hypothetical protein
MPQRVLRPRGDGLSAPRFQRGDLGLSRGRIAASQLGVNAEPCGSSIENRIAGAQRRNGAIENITRAAEGTTT